MYALFLILNDVYLLDDIHEILFECGVGATTMDSMGMGKVLLNHNVSIPMFTNIRRVLSADKPYNKTVVSVIRSEEKLNVVVKKVKEKIGDIKKGGVGFIFVVPVLKCEGFKIEEHEDEF